MSTTPEPEDTGSEPGGEVVPFPRQPADPAPDTPDATSDTSFEVELDDEPAAKPEPVDAGEGIVLPDPDGEHYPVIPEHLRSLAGIGEALSTARPPGRPPGQLPRHPRAPLPAACGGLRGGRGVPAHGPPALLVVAV